MKKNLLMIILFFGVITSLSATTYNVSITDNAFTNANLNITVGDMVVWTNNGSNSHTVTSATSPSGCTADGSWTSPTLTPAATFSHIFGMAGSFPYFCNFHCGSGMKGSVTVTAATGIFHSKVSSSLNIFPNPFTDIITLSVEQGNNNVNMIKVTDALGKEVKNIQMSAGQSSYSLDLSDLQPGMYFCNLYSSDGIVETRKIFHTR